MRDAKGRKTERELGEFALNFSLQSNEVMGCQPLWLNDVSSNNVKRYENLNNGMESIPLSSSTSLTDVVCFW